MWEIMTAGEGELRVHGLLPEPLSSVGQGPVTGHRCIPAAAI
jgi:hypothetical protein